MNYISWRPDLEQPPNIIYVDFIRRIRVEQPMIIPEVHRVNRLLSYVWGYSLRNQLERIRRIAEDEEKRNSRLLFHASKEGADSDPDDD